ncbi:hypothetical protein DPSP01_008531 [Paraphaeosphaeria sporulosa]
MIRLLHVRRKEFKEFYESESVPLYAILSHRWMHVQRNGKYRALEISHREFLAGTGDEKGYEKIDKACEAVRDLSQKLVLDLEWIWIDSCCIDNNNNEEHSEAINSMYDCDKPSEWFKRGWTLQELIAPEVVLFYDKDWIGCGSRNEYTPGIYGGHSFQDRSKELAAITRIDATLLRLNKRKDIKRWLNATPACQKMSWASDRRTSKKEDMAYCLIGIFDIPHMYLKRGEGGRAFIRLQEEIIKQSSDLTLFAWKLSFDNTEFCTEDNYLDLEDLKRSTPEDAPFFDSSLKSNLHGVFACGPCHFRHASQITPMHPTVYNDEVTVTSKGVKLTTPLLGSGPFHPFKTPLYCIDQGDSNMISIELRLLGGSVYARTDCTQLPELHRDWKIIPSQDEVYLAHNIHRFHDCIRKLHRHAIRLPDSLLHLQRQTVSPGYLWSNTHRLMMTNGRRFFIGFATYRSADAKFEANLLFGLDHMLRPWSCFSNIEPSFEPLPLEARKSYLERVWRPASQHDQTVCCDEPKHFMIKILGTGAASMRTGITGIMSVTQTLYRSNLLFEVKFRNLRVSSALHDPMGSTRPASARYIMPLSPGYSDPPRQVAKAHDPPSDSYYSPTSFSQDRVDDNTGGFRLAGASLLPLKTEPFKPRSWVPDINSVKRMPPFPKERLDLEEKDG